MRGNFPSPPDTNLDIFCRLFALETAIRELIIELLEKLAGPRWYKTRLGGDLLKKYQDGLRYVRNIRWTELIPHHPIYYLDFPDLIKVIERDDNWRDAFKSIFDDKALIQRLMRDLEGARNAVAHNRKASRTEKEVVEINSARISQIIGNSRFDNLTMRCTCIDDIGNTLGKLRGELSATQNLCRGIEQIVVPQVLIHLESQWWFDDSYLNVSLASVEHLSQLLAEYVKLPRHRGTGHLIESWIKEHELDDAFASAIATLSTLLERGF